MKEPFDQQHAKTDSEGSWVERFFKQLLQDTDRHNTPKFAFSSRATILLIFGLMIIGFTPNGRQWASNLRMLSAFRSGQTANANDSDATTILPVETFQVTKVHTYQVKRTYTGTIVPRRTSPLSFERAGKLLSLTIDQGDQVERGMPLAYLDTQKLRVKHQELIAGRNQIDALLKELKTGSRSETIAAERSSVKNLDSQLKLAQSRHQRRQALYTAGAIPREHLDEATTEVNTVQARLNEAQSQLDKVLTGSRPEKIEAQTAALEQLEARLDGLEIDLRQSILRAPFTGRIANRLVDEGTVVSAGQPILTLLEDQALEAHVGVPVEAATQIPIGSNQHLVIGKEQYEAEVIATLPQIDPVTRTLTVVLQIEPSASREVRSGQITRLKLTETIDDFGYWLPTTALVRGVRGLWSCYALREAETSIHPPNTFQVEKRDVEVLYTQGDKVFVRGTLQNNDQVIVNGNHRLIAGQLVHPVEVNLSVLRNQN
ncbi:efflux RND transporter periplasmic adaptor subunit [Acaryochloris sp. IP29b_bin.137]|uniref:efflux RND transporter periplasmic adaptor subunit n=1 Tax=Acaryochloris sp. IP29b_bin.137 TaxID=2969217 RepID=UPI0026319DEE|nr:efflux RND transporter periplasmic adaptor subunit [Acaryochloris sp. IP29b_bin.137]